MLPITLDDISGGRTRDQARAGLEHRIDFLAEHQLRFAIGILVGRGEFRQAQRALFLAILSSLASRRFITVERWKTNTDYEKELGRKAKHLSDLPALFSLSRVGFERCWYGEERVTVADLEKYNLVYERIKRAAV